MHFNANSVTCGVSKPSVVPGLFEQLTPSFVHLTGFYAGPHSFYGGKLRLANCLIHPPVRLGSTTYVYGASHIGAITAEYNTVIQDYKSVAGNGRHGSPSVRQG